MINSTSMTSTIGVTLISAMTGLRRLRRPPPPPDEPAAFIAMIWCSRSRSQHTAHLAPLVDLAREDGGEFIREPLQALSLPVHLGDELIVENSRRNCGNEADRGGKQRLRNAWSDDRERGIFRGGNRLEARHDAPDCTEQADERAGRAD